MGTLQIRGNFENAESDSSAILVTLPANYGLGASDRIGASPEMFGHEDQSWWLEPDENGIFAVSDINTIYHVTICLFPPLGAVPDHPPLPVYFLRFSGKEHHMYIIRESESGRPVYSVVDTATDTEVPLHKADWFLHDMGYYPVDDGRGWLLMFSVSRNKKFP